MPAPELFLEHFGEILPCYCPHPPGMGSCLPGGHRQTSAYLVEEQTCLPGIPTACMPCMPPWGGWGGGVGDSGAWSGHSPRTPTQILEYTPFPNFLWAGSPTL